MPMHANVELMDLLARLGLAMLFGGLIGLDREMRHRPAGIRTMMLVAVGAATFVLVGLGARFGDGAVMSPADVSRIIQGIVGGIGFLGAGVVLRVDDRVKGVTTAAAVWATAAVGVACGMGDFRLATVVGLMTLTILTVMNVLERVVVGKKGSRKHREQGPGADEGVGG